LRAYAETNATIHVAVQFDRMPAQVHGCTGFSH
jgi:hypothetical protein